MESLRSLLFNDTIEDFFSFLRVGIPEKINSCKRVNFPFL